MGFGRGGGECAHDESSLNSEVVDEEKRDDWTVEGESSVEDDGNSKSELAHVGVSHPTPKVEIGRAHV